jgi:hypothetical protein
MARTIEEVEKAGGIDLKAEADFDSQLNRAVQTSLTQLRNVGPTGRLGWLRQALTELGIPTDSLTRAQDAADVAANMSRRIYGRQAEAARRRQEALAKLADNPDDDALDAAVTAYMAASAWLDVAPGQQQPPAVELGRIAGRHVESRVGGALMAAGLILFDLVRAKAAAVVDEVASLSKFPDVWTMSNAAEELSKYRAHRASWGLWWRQVRISAPAI